MHTTIRVFFEKRDRAKYISHLDITRCFSRAISRTDIPVWYTEGFNPRIYMTFPLPISLGYESRCESLDIRLIDENYPLERVTQELNKVLPEGILIIYTALPEQKPEAISRAEYTLSVESDQPGRVQEAFATFAGREAILVMKRSKKGQREVDIKPMFQVVSTEEQPGLLVMKLRLAAGLTSNLSPTLLMDAFAQDAGLTGLYYRVERTAIIDSDEMPWQ